MAMAPRPFRFGAKATTAASGKEWADIARRAEDLGYCSLQIDDHYFDPQLAPVPAIMAAACATETIAVGTLVAGVDFRNPVVLAKECATIDLLSGGRFMLGIGAGWSKDDYAAVGVPQEGADTRIERLEEAVAIMRGLWGEGEFSFEGKHYQCGSVDARRRPAGDIPVLIGGGGRKILSLAARTADIVGINPKIVARSINPRSMATAAADAVDERIGWIREAAGDRFDELELQMQVFFAMVTDDPGSMAEALAPAFGLTPELVLTAPYFQLGTIDQISENLQAIRERWGINYIAFQQDATEPVAPIVAKLAGT